MRLSPKTSRHVKLIQEWQKNPEVKFGGLTDI